MPPNATAWELAASGLTTDTRVIAIAVSPNYAADHILLATAGWSEGSTQHSGVFRSTDGGVNWQLTNTGLPDMAIRYIAFSPNTAADHTGFRDF